jgi:hypothetical protein
MTALQNRIRPGGFIQSEGDFARARDRVTILGGTGGAGKLFAGTVLGMITASGKYVASPNTGSDGSQTAVAILFGDVDATVADVAGVAVIARAAEVRAEDLTYDASVTTLLEQQAKWAQLAAVGILVRTMGGVLSS